MPLAAHQALMNTPLCQFIHNHNYYRLTFEEIYDNCYPVFFTKGSHLSTLNFVAIFLNYTIGSFSN